MLYLEIGLLLALLLVSSLGPGLFFIRRLKWDALETLVASIALSHLLVFAAAMLTFACGIPRSLEYLVTAVAVLVTLWCRRDIAGLLRDKRARCALVVWIGLFFWLLVAAFNIYNYSGGGWYGDWFGHYDRVLHFAHRGDVQAQYHQVVGGLAARPPLMNLLGAHFLNQVGLRFELFQVAFIYLNSMAFFGAVLLTSKRSTRPIVLLGVALALTPFFVQNATYTWTKLYTAFFVVTGIAFYGKGVATGDFGKTVFAFAVLATGMITHYSTGPYLVLLALHYMGFEWWWRRRRFLELTVIFVSGSLILAAWFAWALATYGTEETFTANTSVAEYAEESASEAVDKVLDNFAGTLVPHTFRDVALPIQGVDNELVELRDEFFVFFQHNLFGLFGLTGSFAAIWLLVRGRAAARRHWQVMVFFVLAFVLGVVVHGGGYGQISGTGGSWGVAHICLQPIVLMGLCWIVNGWDRLPLVVRRLIILGKVFEVGAGIVLQAYIQGSPPRLDRLGLVAIQNLDIKEKRDVCLLGDAFRDVSSILVPVTLALPLLVLAYGFVRARAHEPELPT